MTARRVTVLGGAGFIGSHLVERLVADGHTVRVFDKEDVDTRNLASVLDTIELIGGDFLNQKVVADACADSDVVYHLIHTTLPASATANPAYDLETNIVGTVRLMDILAAAGVRRVVFASSGGTVYGPARTMPIAEDHPTEPMSAYGVSKLACEKYIALLGRLRGAPYTIFRTANPYGPRQETGGVQGAVSVFLHALLNGEPITVWGDGTVVRDYIAVDDVVAAFAAPAADLSKGADGVYNLGTGVGTSLNDLIALLENITGRTAKVIHTPGRAIDVPVNVLDCTRAHQELGWSAAIELREGLTQLYEHMRAAP